MQFVLIDYQPEGAQVNRDQTGTYGSYFHSEGLLGSFLSRLKTNNVRLPVLSFSYATAILRSAGHSVKIVTGMPEDGGDVAIFATVMYHWKEDAAFLRRFREKFPKTKLGVTGAFSQTLPELYRDFTDFIIKGDIEPPIFAFLDGKWGWEGFFEAGGDFNLDDLPLPDWTGFPTDKYSYRPVLTKKNFLPVQTARGCAFDCSFCPYMVAQGKRMRYRSPARVEEEIRMLAKSFGVRSILFRDILFGAPRKRAVEISERIASIGLGVEWACEMHIKSLDDELIKKMAASGLKAVNLGIESGDPETLEGSGKKSTEIDRVRHIANELDRNGVKVQAFYILGLWKDSPRTMQRTIDLAYELNTYSAQFCVATPFPGTPFFEEVKDKLMHRDWSQYTEYQPVMSIPNATPEEIIEARNRAYRYYYIRPQWMLKYGLGAIKGLLAKR